MSTATQSQNATIAALRRSLAQALSARERKRVVLLQANNNLAQARDAHVRAQAALDTFEGLNVQAAQWKANAIKSGKGAADDLPVELKGRTQAKQEAAAAVNDALNAVNILQVEADAAQRECDAACKAVSDAAADVARCVAYELAGSFVAQREALYDAWEIIAGFSGAGISTGGPSDVASALQLDHVMQTPGSWRSYPVAHDPRVQPSLRWTRFLDALQQDAAAQFEQY